jgi:hypothetical protein
MYNEELEIDKAQADWMLHRRFSADVKTNAMIRREVENYLEKAGGYPAPAHFERFYLQLLNDGKIQPFRGSLAEQPAAAPPIPPEIVAWIESPRVSSFEQRRRYATDPQFKKYYDLYLNTQLKAKVAAEEKEEELSVDTYNSMARIDVVKRYRSSPSFKRGVDRLIAKGLIALVLGLLLHGGML